MATTLQQARRPSRAIDHESRIEQRLKYGESGKKPRGRTPVDLTDAPEAYRQAIGMIEAGNGKCGWSLLMGLLSGELQRRWRATPKHVNSSVTNPPALILKLWNTQQITRDEFKQIQAILKVEKPFTIKKCRALAAFVTVFAMPTIPPPVAAAAPEPINERDLRQVEQWIPVPVAAPVEAPVQLEPIIVEAAKPSPPAKGRFIQPPSYLPTPEEIRAACDRFRAESPRREMGIQRWRVPTAVEPVFN